jgi:TPR repeat protein
LYTLAADAGHQDAQADLGYLYMTGLGVPKSDETAAYWYSQGAMNDSRDARLALGAMYAVGRGVSQSDPDAVYWFAQARQLRFVADAYACGFGVEQDLAMARKLYEDLAEKGDPDAQFQLGNMFAEACGAPLDNTEAARWYEAAAQHGHPDAQIALSRRLREGLGVARNPLGAYQWAELAVLRLERDDAALNDALIARASAGLVTTREERESATEMARQFVRVAQEAIAEQ